jgi:hypothetical protein
MGAGCAQKETVAVVCASGQDGGCDVWVDVSVEELEGGGGGVVL